MGHLSLPGSLVDLHYSIIALVFALVGGVGTIVGPLLGSLLLNVIMEILWSYSLELHLAFLGLVLVFAVLFMPKGIIELLWPKSQSRPLM